MANEDTSKFSTNLNEASILSDILNDKSGNDILTISTSLTIDDFQDAKNRVIYTALMNMNKKGIKPDLTTLTTELEQTKMLDGAGGFDYLSYLTTNFTSLGPVKNYVDNVKDQSLFARFLRAIKDIEDDANNKSIDNIPEFIGKAETTIVNIARQRRVNDVIKMDEVSNNIVASLVTQTEEFKKNGKRPNGVTGVETGYGELDKLTKGWHPGDMVIIAARPSVGKTAFALNLLYEVAKRNIPVIFFSLEMDALHIGLRLLQRTSGLSTDEINSLDYQRGSTADKIIIKPKNDLEIAKISNLQFGINELARLPFYIDDTPNGKMMDIASKAKKLCNSITEPVGLIVIDYLGLITSPSNSNNANRQQEVADISRQLKQMARELKTPIIALSQLSRNTESRQGHKPVLSDLRDSGAIEQDADMVFTLYRKDYYKDEETIGKKDAAEPVVNNTLNNSVSQVEISLLKNRNGSLGNLQFSFDKEHTTFTQITNEYDNGQGPDEVFE